MSESNPPTCPRCGAPTPTGATEHLCPACLLSGALAAPPPPAQDEYPREFGEYRLLGLLGRGGMGTVCDAEHLPTGRRVALKMLGQQIASPEMRQRFLREGRLAAGVSHPNSLYVFGSEEIEGLPVITMEIAGGGTLKDEMKRRGPLPTRDAVDAILDVVAGLEAAHAAGVLHRDIKPSNCFVGPDGRVKIGDFGLSVSTLATDRSYETASGVILGTPAYASPEQLRGDDLDARADIYSVGATLFTLLTGEAPFRGENAVQMVANVLTEEPRSLIGLRSDVPPGLARVVARCIAREPDRRPADYPALRDALLPFSSREPEPATMRVRAAAGWIDYLIAFLVPYVAIMLAIGNEAFHLGFLLERTLAAATPYLVFLCCGILYFTVAEGTWGAGIGKRLKGLRVARGQGRLPGLGRALVRILVPVLAVEGVRIPLLLATFSSTRIDDVTSAEVVIYSLSAALCPWIPILMTLEARPANGFRVVWDVVTGTTVVVKPKTRERASVAAAESATVPAEDAVACGPYRVTREIVPGKWIAAVDPVLRRPVWLRRRPEGGLSLARRNVARPGRVRWLQSVNSDEVVWDAYEAPAGVPFARLTEGGESLAWGTLRHWLHDLATELWSAVEDETAPRELSLDHVWITERGDAVLLDDAWPEVDTAAERVSVADVAGRQRFLNAVAALTDPTGLPLRARPVLRNLGAGRFEKMSFIAGALRGLLDRPAEVSRGIRAASMFLIPGYIWVMCFVGVRQGAEWVYAMIGDSVAWTGAAAAMVVLGAMALAQLVELPFRTTAAQATFGLATVDARGDRASVSRLAMRWAVIWIPLLAPVALAGLAAGWTEDVTLLVALTALTLWIGAALSAVVHPHRGWHDRWTGVRVVRR